MTEETGLYANCDCCGRPMHYGNAAITLARNIEQVDWNKELQVAEATVIKSATLAVLCESCGSSLDEEYIRRIMFPEETGTDDGGT